jgi:hypothetical protein
MCLIGSTVGSTSHHAQHQTAKNHVPVQKERQTSLVTVIGPLKKILGASRAIIDDELVGTAIRPNWLPVSI